MNSRRNFIKSTSALALGGLIAPKLLNASELFKQRPIGIQMFTLMRMAGGDTTELFKNLAAIGFKEIETSFSPKGPFYGYKPKEFRKFLKDLGLEWRSHHVVGGMPRNSNFKMATLASDMQQLVDEAAEGGIPYLVCSSAPVGTLAEIENTVAMFTRTGEACKKAGIQFAYHNHASEFDLVEGKRPYDLIMKGTDEKLVKMELDLAWAVKANQDPVTLFKEYPGRFPLWHVKDIDADRKNITEVGNGIVNFKAAFDAAKIAGMKHFFYEQDTAKDMESVKTSYANLSKILS